MKLKLLITKNALGSLSNLPRSKNSGEVLPSYTRDVIGFLSILQNGGWADNSDKLDSLQQWTYSKETRFSCKVTDNLYGVWEVAKAVDIEELVGLRYSDKYEAEKYIVPHVIIHHVGEFPGVAGSIMNLDDENNFSPEEKVSITSKSLNQITYDEELYRIKDVDKQPDHIMNVINGKQMGLLIQLTAEQAQILRKRTGPLLLSGEAGSGKTTIITHWFLLNIKDWLDKREKKQSNRLTPYRQLFVTSNPLLTEETKKHLEIMLPVAFSERVHHSVDFRTYRHLLFNLLEMAGKKSEFPAENEMDFERFNREYGSTVLQSGLDAVLVWDEIRSVIKGSGGLKSKLIEDSDYADLNENRGQTKVPETYREKYYEQGLRYQRYLEDNSLWDSIDLARECYNVLDSGYHSYDLYDFMACDEVQDLAVIELRTLLKLVSDESNEFGPRLERMFFTGDIAQVINPSGFTWSRLKSLLSEESGRRGDELMNPRHLERNFRSSKQIVELANSALDTRTMMLGPHADLKQQVSLKVGEKPMRVIENPKSPDIVTPKEAIDAVRNAGMVDSQKRMIIVKNKDEKEGLYELLGGADQTNLVVLTIEEAKGLEREGILLWKFFKPRSQMSKDEWENVFIKKKREHYKKSIERGAKSRYALDYEFNLLHVALTRSKSDLYIYDDDPKMNIGNIESMVDKTVPIAVESLTTFWKTELPDTPDKMLETAEELKSRDLQQSRRWFKKAAISFQEKEMLEDAARCFMEANDYASAADCFESAGQKERALWADAKSSEKLDADAAMKWMKHAKLCNVEGKTGNAITSYDRAVDGFERYNEFLLAGELGEEIATFYLRIERKYKAMECYERVIRNYERTVDEQNHENSLRVLENAISHINEEDYEWRAKFADIKSDVLFKTRNEDAPRISDQAAVFWANTGRKDKQVQSLNTSVNQLTLLEKGTLETRRLIVDALKNEGIRCIKEWEKIIEILTERGDAKNAWKEVDGISNFLLGKNRADTASEIVQGHLEWVRLGKHDEVLVLKKYVSCLDDPHSTAVYRRRAKYTRELAVCYRQKNSKKRARETILSAAEKALKGGHMDDRDVGANAYFSIAEKWHLEDNSKASAGSFCLNDIALEYGLKYLTQNGDADVAAELWPSLFGAQARLDFILMWVGKAADYYATPKKNYMESLNHLVKDINRYQDNSPPKGEPMSIREWQALVGRTKNSLEGRMGAAWKNYCKGKAIHSRTNNMENDMPEIIKCYKEANNWLAIRGKSEFSGLENLAFEYFRSEIKELEDLSDNISKNLRNYEVSMKEAMKDGRISPDEEGLLKIQREKLGITPEQHRKLVAKMTPKKKKAAKKPRKSTRRKKTKGKISLKEGMGAIAEWDGMKYEQLVIEVAVAGTDVATLNKTLEGLMEHDLIEPIKFRGNDVIKSKKVSKGKGKPQKKKGKKSEPVKTEKKNEKKKAPKKKGEKKDN